MTLKYIYIVLFLIIIKYNNYSYENEDSIISKKQEKIIDILNHQKANKLSYIEINDLLTYYKYQNMEDGMKFIDTLISIPNVSSDNFFLIDIYNTLANYYNTLNRNDLAASYLYKSINISKKYPKSISNGWSLVEIGNIYYNILQFDKSIQFYKESIHTFNELLKIKKSKKDTMSINHGIAVSLENISLSYLELNNIDSALNYIYLSKKFRINTDLSVSTQYHYLTLGKVFINANMIDSALYYLTKCEEEGKKIISITDKPQQNNFNLQANMGLQKIYFLNNNNIEFENSLRKIDNLINDNNNYGFLIKILIAQSKFYFQRNDILHSKMYGIKALEISNKHKFNFLDASIFHNLYTIYDKLEDKNKSLEYLKLSFNFLDSATKNFRLRSVEMVDITENIENKIKEIDKLNNEAIINNEKMITQKYYLIALVVSSLLLLIIILGLFNRSKYKSKMVKIIESKNENLNSLVNKLNESNDTKNRLFSIIAHDLKNSIGSVRDAINLLNSEYHQLSDDDKIEFLDLSKKSSDNLYFLLENLLVWSSAQKNAITINKTLTFPFSIANQSIQLFSVKAQEKNIKLINNINQELKLNFDPNLIDTVIRNILNNAIKFTNNNGEIKIYSYQNENNEVIVIEDNGIGMPKDRASNLFMGESSKSTYGTSGEKGTGLGLLICKEFVELHNGMIWAESEEGKGTKIIFTLPN